MSAVRRDARRVDDQGMSLAELVVTIGLMALIGTMVASVSIVVMRTYTGVQSRIENSSQAELGIAAAGKVLRTAILPEQLEDTVCVGCGGTAIIQAGPNTVTFYANVGDTTIGPSKVTLVAAADPQRPGTWRLLQQTEAPRSTGAGTYTFCDRTKPATCTIRDHVLSRGLLSSAPGVFTYYDYEGNVMASSSVAGNLSRVSSVDIVLSVKADPGEDVPSRTTVSRVRLPNVEINVLSESA
jgi:phage tail protein X